MCLSNIFTENPTYEFVSFVNYHETEDFVAFSAYLCKNEPDKATFTKMLWHLRLSLEQ